MSSTLSQIAAITAGLALYSAFVVYPGGRARSLAKGMVVSVSLAVLAAVLISAARHFGA